MAETTGSRRARAAGSENESSIGDTMANLSENIKAKASEMGQRVNDAIDEKRNAAADKLDETASRINETARDLSGRMTDIAHRAADRLEQTSEYMREHDTAAVAADVGDFVKRYPAQTIIAAAIGGFLIGRLLGRR